MCAYAGRAAAHLNRDERGIVVRDDSDQSRLSEDQHDARNEDQVGLDIQERFGRAEELQVVGCGRGVNARQSCVAERRVSRAPSWRFSAADQ